MLGFVQRRFPDRIARLIRGGFPLFGEAFFYFWMVSSVALAAWALIHGYSPTIGEILFSAWAVFCLWVFVWSTYWQLAEICSAAAFSFIFHGLHSYRGARNWSDSRRWRIVFGGAIRRESVSIGISFPVAERISAKPIIAGDIRAPSNPLSQTDFRPPPYPRRAAPTCPNSGNPMQRPQFPPLRAVNDIGTAKTV